MAISPLENKPCFIAMIQQVLKWGYGQSSHSVKDPMAAIALLCEDVRKRSAKICRQMHKFLQRFMRLAPPQRDQFLAGIEAKFWGNAAIRKHKLPQLIRPWLQSTKAQELPHLNGVHYFEKILQTTEMARVPSGSLRNIFYRLNQQLDFALPLIMQLPPLAPHPSKAQIATHWLRLGEPGLAEAIFADSPAPELFTVSQLEDRYELHLAYYNHVIHHGLTTKKHSTYFYHFHKLRDFHTAHTLLMEIRVLCSAANMIPESRRQDVWKGQSLEDLRHLPAANIILAFQACRAMTIDPEQSDLQSRWLLTKKILADPAFPKDSHEFRELTRYLLNIVTIKINQGDASIFWNNQGLELLQDAFAHGSLLEKGTLPAQHLVNYCRMAIVVGETATAQAALATLESFLSPADKAQGELEFCQATLHYAEQRYDEAWKAIGRFYPTGKRKLAYFVLRIKIAMEVKRAELESNLDAFINWLNEPKNKKLLGQRYAAEWERLKVIKRIVTLQYGSQNLKNRLWRDIGKVRIDRKWLKSMYILYLGQPALSADTLTDAETQEDYE
jgi:hypothetical protein